MTRATPSSHILALTVPCSRDSFVARARSRVRDGLVDTLLRHDWRDLLIERGLDACADAYDKQVVHIDRAQAAALAAGFVVVREPAFEHSRAWFDGDNVIVLVAHASDGRIEFVDRMATLEQMLSVTPPDFGGAIDLIGCETACTGDQLKFARTRARVLFGRRPTPLDQQLFLFRGALEFMRRLDLPYEAAVMQLRIEWAKRKSSQVNS